MTRIATETLLDIDLRQIVSSRVQAVRPVTNFLRATSHWDLGQVKSWLPPAFAATRKEIDSHLSTVESSACDSYSFFVLPPHSGPARRVPSQVPLSPSPFPSPSSPLSLSLSLSFFPLLSSASTVVRIYHLCATFSLLRIESESRRPRSQPLRFGLRVRILEMRGTENGGKRWWKHRFEEAGRRGMAHRRGRTPRKLHTRLRSTEEWRPPPSIPSSHASLQPRCRPQTGSNKLATTG